MERVVFLNPLDLSVISYDGKNFSDKFDKKAYVGSRLSYNDIILHSFKVPTNTSDEEIASQAEIKMYEEAGLDLQKKYKISYIKKELDFEENFLVEAFAVDVDRVKDYLSEVLKTTKYIDFLALPFLCYETLYKNKVIAPKSDVFVYLGEQGAFLAIYKDGNYLSSKSITNLSSIVDSLKDLGYNISLEKLFEVLENKGLDATLYERGESILYNKIEEEFVKIFTKINDVVIYNRSIFGFEQADRIFVSFKNGRIKGLREFVKSFGLENVELLDFNLFKDRAKSHFLDRIATSYIYDKLAQKDSSQNLTIFPREAPFYKKQSGQFILAGATTLLLACGYIGFLKYEISNLQTTKAALSQKYDDMQKVVKKYKTQIGKLKKELKDLADEEKKIDAKLETIDKSISWLESATKKKKTYSSFVLGVNKLLKRYGLATTQIKLIGKDKMELEIIARANKRDNIAKFMKELIKSGFVGVKTDEIKIDKDLYVSKIEISR